MKYRSLFLIAMLTPFLMVGALTNDLFFPYLPQLSKEFADLSQYAHLSISIPMLVMGLGQLLWGRILDRVPVIRVLSITIMLHMFGSLLCAITNNWNIFFLGRTFQALGACGLFASAIFCTKLTCTPTQAPIVTARILALTGAGPIYAPFLTAFLTILCPHWRTAIFSFLVLYGTFLLSLLYFKRDFFTLTNQNEHQKSSSFFEDVKEIYSNNEFRSYAAIPCLVLTGLIMFFSFSTFFLSTEIGLSPIQVRMVFATHAALYLLTPFTLLSQLRSVNQKTIIRNALLTIVLMTLVLKSLATIDGQISLLAFLSCALVLPICYALIYGPSLQLTLSTIPLEKSGLATALLGMMQFSTASAVTSFFLHPPHVALSEFTTPIQLLSLFALTMVVLHARKFRAAQISENPVA